MCDRPDVGCRVAIHRIDTCAWSGGDQRRRRTLWRKWICWRRIPGWPGYHYLPAIRADLLRRLGRHEVAAEACRTALTLIDNKAERKFLTTRLTDVASV